MKPSLFVWFLFIAVGFNGCKKDETDNGCPSYPRPTDTYKYPIRPGTSEWANLHSGDEMLQACQIPNDLLKQMSTQGLVQTWLDMPLNNEITMANSPEKAMIFFIEKFSGLKELVLRNDAADELFKRYQFYDPSCVTSYKGIKQGEFVLSSIYIDLPLAQDTILNKMTLQQKKALMREALNKYDLRIKYDEYYDVLTTDLSLFICAKAMVTCQYQPFFNELNNNLRWFIDNAQFPIPLGNYTAERNIIVTQAENFIR